ncbi:hypothetical protein Tcan_16054 [Toxocara canis]|nr:hypothetical protein Tcan_16054 [Toxocara canis]
MAHPRDVRTVAAGNLRSRRLKRQWGYPYYYGYGPYPYYGGYYGFNPGFGNNYGGLRIGWISRTDIWG